MPAEYLPCPFCGNQPVREVMHDRLSVYCPNCVSVGFHIHVRLGCMADSSWNKRAGQVDENLKLPTTNNTTPLPPVATPKGEIKPDCRKCGKHDYGCFWGCGSDSCIKEWSA